MERLYLVVDVSLGGVAVVRHGVVRGRGGPHFFLVTEGDVHYMDTHTILSENGQ